MKSPGLMWQLIDTLRNRPRSSLCSATQGGHYTSKHHIFVLSRYKERAETEQRSPPAESVPVYKGSRGSPESPIPVYVHVLLARTVPSGYQTGRWLGLLNGSRVSHSWCGLQTPTTDSYSPEGTPFTHRGCSGHLVSWLRAACKEVVPLVTFPT